MIDRDTAIQWANDCGVWVDSHGCSVVASMEGIERLITRAQNEALEQAALLFNQPYMEYFGENIQDEIRALKQEVGK